MGIDHPGLFGTELNMGYVQGFAKRKLSSRIYGGLGLEYDTRDNLVYPTKGLFITNQTNFISDAFGSTLESLGADLHPVEQSDYFFAKNITRATFYASLDGTWRSVLATRYGMRVGLGDVPVSMWENANNWIRGYREGRFTGKQLHFLDLEWRKYFTNRMGFALGRNGEKSVYFGLTEYF